MKKKRRKNLGDSKLSSLGSGAFIVGTLAAAAFGTWYWFSRHGTTTIKLYNDRVDNVVNSYDNY